MSDITSLAFQRENKPKIEDVIPLCVAGEYQKSALGFVAWLRTNKMAPGWSGVHNAWDAKCKGSTICKISIGYGERDIAGRPNKHSWEIKLYCYHQDRYAKSIVNEGLQSIVWNGLYTCVGCLGGKKPCIGGSNHTVYGKEFKGICGYSFGTRIYDPDEATVESIKRMLELEQKARIAG